MFMSFIFKYTLFSLQGHICLLQGHKVCTRTCYFNACCRAFLSDKSGKKYKPTSKTDESTMGKMSISQTINVIPSEYHISCMYCIVYICILNDIFNSLLYRMSVYVFICKYLWY